MPAVNIDQMKSIWGHSQRTSVGRERGLEDCGQIRTTEGGYGPLRTSALIFLYCPSVQKKIAESGGDRYQCVFSGCKKLFTMLELAKSHLKVSGHRKLAQKESIDDCMDVNIVDEEIKICSAAPLVAINDFMQKPFVEVAGLYDEDEVDE